MPRIYTKRSIRERLDALCEKAPDGCWLWTGHVGKAGYGMFIPKRGEGTTAHRVSFMEASGIAALPREIDVCHRCDVKRCINPAHLFLGTRTDNIQDAIAKGRFYPPGRRKSACKRGHPFTPENTYRPPKNPTHRHCKACQATRQG